MTKIKNWFVKNRYYFYPALLVFIIMFISFLIKGVHPFGNKYTGLIDYAHGLVPSYTHLWDFIHGQSNFLYNENLGMGANMYASSVLNTFFSPLSYIVGLFSRENVQYAIGYIVVIKLMLMATIAYIMFRKWFKNVDNKQLCLFSLLWSFSSWLLVHISNVGWLDVMIIFPLLIDAIKVLVEKAKMSYYVGILTLCLIFSYYMSYMILIGIITGITCACFTIIKKEDRKRVIGQIFIGTLFSLFISMFAFLPSFIQTQTSYRFTDEMTDGDGFAFYTKVIMLLFYGVILFLPFKLFKGHKEDKNVKFLMSYLLVLLLPVIIEPINKMWHTGSYFSYPFRFSYIPIFFLIISSLYYLNNYYNQDNKEKVKLKPLEEVILYVSLGLWLCGSIVYIIAEFYNKIHFAYNISFGMFIAFAVVMILPLVIITLIHKSINKDKRKIFLGLITISQILLYTIGYMGIDNYGDVYSIKNNYDIDSLSDDYGFKDETRKLISNYPLVLDHKSVSTWLHINGMYANINARALGYGTIDTQIKSYGGTAFSDMLSNTRYVLSYNQLSSSVYNLLEVNEIEYNNETSKVYLYEYKYNLPLGLIVEEDIELLDFDRKEDPFYNQNMIYKQLFNKSEDIIDIALSDKRVTEKEYEISLTQQQLLYFYSTDLEYEDVKIYINDKLLENLSGNGILNLGVYDNEVVKIKIVSEEELKDLEFATLSVDKLYELSEENNSEVKMVVDGNKIKVEVNASNKGKLYLPINYEDNSWSASVNGKEVVVERFMECYLSVDVEKGENIIELKFTPMGMELGIKLTIITLILVAILWCINLKYKFFSKKGIIIVSGILGSIIGIAIGGYVYLIPLMK